MLPINLEFLDNNNATIDNVSVMSLALGQKVKLSIADQSFDVSNITWYSDADPVLSVSVASDKLSAVVEVSSVGLSHVIIGQPAASAPDIHVLAVVSVTAKPPLGQAVSLNIVPGTPVTK
jgi:hypothetical protein